MAGIRRVIRYLGLISGVLSLVLLTRLAFETDFAAPFRVALTFYDSIVSAALAWLDPWLGPLAEKFGAMLGLDWTLKAHWRHIFVLMWLYFAADIGANWGLGRSGFAVFSFLWGGVVALAVSIAAGSVALQAGTAYRLALIPVIGMVAFETLRIAWSAAFYGPAPRSGATGSAAFWRYFIHFVLPVIVCGAAAILVGAPIAEKVVQNGAAGIVVVLAFLVFLAAYWLGRGVWLGFRDRAPGESWRARYWRSGSARLGVAVYQVLIGCVIFIAANAGLEALRP